MVFPSFPMKQLEGGQGDVTLLFLPNNTQRYRDTITDISGCFGIMQLHKPCIGSPLVLQKC